MGIEEDDDVVEDLKMGFPIVHGSGFVAAGNGVIETYEIYGVRLQNGNVLLFSEGDLISN